MAKKVVPQYPTLKSKRAAFKFNFRPISFSRVMAQTECHAAMSMGAGIHPTRAIKNPICATLDQSNWVWNSGFKSGLAPRAQINAKMVVAASNTMTHFIKRSKKLYLPQTKMTMHIIKINALVPQAGRDILNM